MLAPGFWRNICISLIGFAPLLILLWITLRKYTYPHTEYTCFDERKAMYFLTAGIVVGLIFAFLWQVYSILSIGYAVFFAICEELVKVVILNYPKFQLKFDTTFYGCTFGLGFGAIVVIAIAYNTENVLESEKLLVAITLAFSYCFLHCTTGGLIGFGSYKKMMWTYSLPAIIIHLIFNLAIIPTFFWSHINICYSISSLAGCSMFAGFAYVYCLKNILPYSLPEDMIRKRRRKLRKKLR